VIETTTSSAGIGETQAQWQGRSLYVARIVWIALTLFACVLFLASLPGTWRFLQTVCSDGSCNLTSVHVEQLRAVGLSPDFFAWYLILLALIVSATFLIVATVIFVRRSENRQPRLGALGLAIF
jgi:hypothetical protein